MIQSLRTAMSDLNATITADTRNLGQRYVIGHSFFCPRENISDFKAWARSVVLREIGPLLEEYWYDNPEKVKSEIAKLEQALA